MAESLITSKSESKAASYAELIPQIKGLVSAESDLIANLANMAAALKYGMDFFWVGFYLVKEDMLVLGPFQGPLACTRIARGKGVCGKSWEEHRTIIVEDVDQFPGHIACSADSRSEIVVPLIQDGTVRLVLDVDSDKVNTFDQTDAENLKRLLEFLPKVQVF